MTHDPGAWHLVPADAVAPQPWRNGGGLTRELLRLPAAPDGDPSQPWCLRISLADIDGDGPFSAFAGTQRWFAVVQGAGVSLEWRAAGGRLVRRVTPASPPLGFDGACAPDCRLLAGPTRDLNVMARGAGALLDRAAWHRPWIAPGEGRGLFARTALVLHDGHGTALPVPAGTLAWCTRAGTTAWSIAPDPSSSAAGATAEDDGAPPAWWVGLAPAGGSPASAS